jgi:predicted phosphodiesterase
LQELQAGSIPVSIIRGNNEGCLLTMQRRTCPPGYFTSRQWGVTRWAWEQLGDEGMAWVERLPKSLSIDHYGGGILLLHGSPRRDDEGLIPDRDPATLELLFRAGLLDPGQTNVPLGETLERIDEAILVCGHIHIPWQQREGRKLAVNPGSVGLPNNADPRAQYALLDTNGFSPRVLFRALPYDRAAVKARIEHSGMLEAGGGVARAIQVDLERADYTLWNFVQHCYKHARAVGAADGAVIPDEVWQEAEERFVF